MASDRWRKANRHYISEYQRAWRAERNKDPLYREHTRERQRRNYRRRAKDISYRHKLTGSVRAFNLALQKKSETFTRGWLPSKWTPLEEILLLCLFPTAAKTKKWEMLFSTFRRSYFSIRTKYHKLRRLALASI